MFSYKVTTKTYSKMRFLIFQIADLCDSLDNICKMKQADKQTIIKEVYYNILNLFCF